MRIVRARRQQRIKENYEEYCPGGEIGRRKGLKIPRGLTPMPVRFRPRAPTILIVTAFLMFSVF